MFRCQMMSRARWNMIATRSRYKVVSHGSCELYAGWSRPLGVERGADKPCVIIAPDQAQILDHPLICHLCSIANLSGLAVFRFNFRGATPSQGNRSLDGIIERSDALVCVEEVLRYYSSVILIGIKYGAMILGSLLAPSAPASERIKGFCAISYPLNSSQIYAPKAGLHYQLQLCQAVQTHHLFGRRERHSVLFVHGSRDQTAQENASTKDFYRCLGVRPVLLSGCDEFSDLENADCGLAKVMCEWLPKCGNTEYNPSLSLLGFR